MVVEAVVKRHPNPGHRWVLRAVLKPECPQEGNRQAERIWSEVRKAYPDQWLVVEALEAHTEGHQRLLDRSGLFCLSLCHAQHTQDR
jgi:hypothetical protein